jgi:hypothetical protein
MKPKYSAIIKYDTPNIIAMQFARPLSPETSAKFKELEQNEGISIFDIPKELGKNGYYVVLSDVWNITEIAQECLNILVLEGFDKASVHLDITRQTIWES